MPSKKKYRKRKQGLTPYQGNRRCYGYFRCDCGRTWESGNSWADMGQECINCEDNVYPYSQKPLEYFEDNDDGKEHLSSLCEMCQTLGYDCRKH